MDLFIDYFELKKPKDSEIINFGSKDLLDMLEFYSSCSPNNIDDLLTEYFVIFNSLIRI